MRKHIKRREGGNPTREEEDDGVVWDVGWKQRTVIYGLSIVQIATAIEAACVDVPQDQNW